MLIICAYLSFPKINGNSAHVLPRTSANRSEATLDSISREIGRSNKATNNLDQQLFSIQQSISKTHQAILFQNTAVNYISHSISSNSQSQPRSAGQCSSSFWRASRVFDEPSSAFERSQSQQHTESSRISIYAPAVYGKGNFGRAVIISDDAGSTDHDSVPSSVGAPTSLFEISQNFFPETYTMHQRVPKSCLMVFGSYEESFTGQYKTNLYRLMFMKSPRQWCRLRVSINIRRSSIYWAATNTTHREYRTMDALLLLGGASLPPSLSMKMQAFLSRTEQYDDDTHLCFSLSDQDSLQNYDLQPHINLSPVLTGTRTGFLKPSRDALAFLEDLGCPWYYEKQVTQVALLEPPNRFISDVCGILVYETMFVGDVPSPELLYNVQLLHCMNRTPGFPRLVGFVKDNDGAQLQSSLIEFPRVQFKVRDATLDGSVSWERREKWARQLVEGVSRVHSQGFVIGTLTAFWQPVIDTSDNVQLWYFKKKFATCQLGDCYYPPECRHFRNLSPTITGADCPNITSKADLYDLGLLLWVLAENVGYPCRSPVCIREHCAGPVCDESHRDPIALPRLDDHIPQYFKDIVDACRAERPEDRLPARTLLELFPPQGALQSSQACGSTVDGTDVTSLGKRLLGTVSCDGCRNSNIAHRLYHCCTCKAGNFDICQACYNAGMHCPDKDHLLVEMENVGDYRGIALKYHSSVKRSGERDVIEL